MTQTQFLEKRRAAWERLEALLALSGRRGLRALDGDAVQELARLYRWASSDLAYAQGHDFDANVLAYLNRLVARAHAVIYRAGTTTGRERVLRFFTQTFPAEVRRSLVPICACIALTVIAAMVSYAITRAHPEDAFAIMPASMIPANVQKSLHDSNFAVSPQDSSLMSSEIITNNIKVTIMAFGGGPVTLGVLTLYIIIFNGLMVGVLGALFTQAGFGYDFWATVAPHGVIELTAIQIAGGAGLLLAAAILAPGRLRRRDAIAQAGQRAGVLIAGVVAMLCVAGTIEGFFSPLRFGPEVRIGVGALTGAILLWYFCLCGRAATEGRVP